MIVIGITGSIGMGKSTVAEMIADEYNAPVHNADDVVRALLAPSGAAVADVAQTFPDSYDRKTKRIDRAKLAEIVFDDPEKKQALEDILHPMVRDVQKQFLQQNARRKFVVLDIPLLFETGGEVNCDYTICVTAPYHIQRQRVLARGMAEEEFIRRLSAQMPDEIKRQRADFVVNTGISFADTLKQIKKIMCKIKGG